ncbi:MAG: winged helix-turn-helix transcriptional regulator [Nitrososphaera sp.]
MDAKDVRIFCEMAFKGIEYETFTDRRVSPLSIARKLGLDEKTVRSRVSKMEEEGFIKYYQAIPSLSFLNVTLICSYRFETVNIATKHRVIEDIRKIPFIVEAIDYLGHHISVNIAGRSAELVEDTVAKLANKFELSRMLLAKWSPKQNPFHPDRLDWQIIQKLRYDALSSTKAISESLSLTQRMVDYRIQKLLDSRVLSVRAVIDPQKQKGLIFYELEMAIVESMQFDVVKRLGEIHGEKLWSVKSSATVGVLIANFFAFSLAEPEQSVVSALGIEGVKSCSMFIIKETIEPDRPNWLDGLIDERILSSN